MEILYSNIPPLRVKAGQKLFINGFREAASEADQLDIAVGYVSKESLLELEQIVNELKIQKIRLNMGMYMIEGIPESMYHTAVEVNERWEKQGIGEIFLVRPFKYHGKVYVFYRKGVPFCAFIGSHNLGALKLNASNRRQYEISAETRDEEEVREIAEFVSSLGASPCSVNIADINSCDIKLIREINTALSGVEFVSEIPDKSVELYQKHQIGNIFKLPLKVPSKVDLEYDRIHGTETAKFTRSNINVCYAKPRSSRKNRNWYETQLTVSKEVRQQDGYPEKNHPFFVVTDDGYWFKAHTTSDNNKQFSAVGDELIMGRWLKGRLVAAGLVSPVNDTGEDTERCGMITREMLAAYGADSLVFSKTDQKAVDEDGTELPVWTLSFISEKSVESLEQEESNR